LNEGDERLAEGDVDAAIRAYQEATRIVPDDATNGEAAFWVGVTLADVGRESEASAYLARAYAQDVRWAEVLRRLPASDLLPDDGELIDRLLASMGAE